MQRGIRYLLPAFPFVILWVAQAAARLADESGRAGRIFVAACLTAGAVESLAVHPHHLMFFNAWAGGADERSTLLRGGRRLGPGPEAARRVAEGEPPPAASSIRTTAGGPSVGASTTRRRRARPRRDATRCTRPRCIARGASTRAASTGSRWTRPTRASGFPSTSTRWTKRVSRALQPSVLPPATCPSGAAAGKRPRRSEPRSRLGSRRRTRLRCAQLRLNAVDDRRGSMARFRGGVSWRAGGKRLLLRGRGLRRWPRSRTRRCTRQRRWLWRRARGAR